MHTPAIGNILCDNKSLCKESMVLILKLLIDTKFFFFWKNTFLSDSYRVSYRRGKYLVLMEYKLDDDEYPFRPH